MIFRMSFQIAISQAKAFGDVIDQSIVMTRFDL